LSRGGYTTVHDLDVGAPAPAQCGYRDALPPTDHAVLTCWDILANELPELRTAEQISDFLARVVVLLAQGRISPRRAAVFTYACGLLLRSAVVIDRKLVDDFNNMPHSIFDMPIPDHSHNHEPAQPEPVPLTQLAQRNEGSGSREGSRADR
jgi:hypothetical protein